MNCKRITRAALLALGVSWLSAAAPALAAEPAGPTDRLVNPGAVLEIAVYAAGEKELEFTATVAPDSTIVVPLAGTTRVGGLAAAGIAERLQAILGKDYLVHPQVLVNVKEYGGRVLVWGEVRQPGLYALGQGLSVLSAVVMAGGFTDFAAAGKARVVRTRGGGIEVVRLDIGRILKGKEQDIVLRDGDRLEVPRRLF